VSTLADAARPTAPPKRTLAAASGAHAVHDGFSDTVVLFLPFWQAEFGLSLAATGALKTLFTGMMAVFQVPMSALAERWGAAPVLVVGTAVVGAGFVAAGAAGGVIALALCLAAAGLGSSTQHPLASALVSKAYDGPGRRVALGTYNFAGDVGKVLLPGSAALIIAWAGWESASFTLGILGLAAAAILAIALHGAEGAPAADESDGGAGRIDYSGFISLAGISLIDSGTRTGFLAFLSFLLLAKGAPVGLLGVALGLVFAGGASGKFLCGLLAMRLGLVRTIIVTELMTAALIVALVFLPLWPAFVVLPLAGLALNGTSSVLYATVGEFVDAKRRTRAFGIFYTVSIGSSAAAPILFGFVGDIAGVEQSMLWVAALVLCVMPLTIPLRSALRRIGHA
jgi:MFS transporter, FSR family, fosmidomycin resistance protein